MNLDQCLDLSLTIYAHTHEQKEKELLQEHTELCNKYFDRIYKEKNIRKRLHRIWRIIIPDLLNDEIEFLDDAFRSSLIAHDMGKVNPVFQIKNMNNPSKCWKEWGAIAGQESAHSLLSSFFYLDFFYAKLKEKKVGKEKEKYFRYILWLNSYVISRHHSDLNDVGEYLEKFKEKGEVEGLFEYFKKNNPDYYKGLFFFNEKVTPAKTLGKLKKAKDSFNNQQTIYLFFYIRLLYSILVCCDYYATNEYQIGMEMESFGDISNRESYYKEFNATDVNKSIRKYEKERSTYREIKEGENNINILRNELFLETEKVLKENRDEAVFFLEAPTGSGKSNTAMNLSFEFLKDEKQKLFYVYPFNALVEQNKKTLDQIFQNSDIKNQIVVLNSIYPAHESVDEKNYEKMQDYYNQILLDKQFLNYPFILTTHVKLFLTLFSERKEDVFSFYQLSDSVLVFDEIQSYRNEIWTEIVIYLKVLADIMGCKIIMMSATFPNLDILSEEYSLSVPLIKDRNKFFKHHLFKDRVEVSYELLEQEFDLEILREHIEQQTKIHNKVLVEFIKKQSAKEFYQMMKEEEGVFLITGDDNLYDREEIIDKIRDNKLEKVILIATQVVEAGVDIDMDIGYKDISIVDSDEQFLGRINRSAKKQGNVFFFSYDNVEYIYKRDVRTSRGMTLQNNEMREILKNKEFDVYYNKVLQILKDKKKGNKDKGINDFYEKNRYLQLKEISKHMKLIEEDQWKKSVCFCRSLDIKGEEWDGKEIWDTYKNLLLDSELSYSERMVKLMNTRAKLQYFIYDVPKHVNIAYDDQIGELLCIEDGEQYFEDGKLRDDIYGGTYVDIL